MQLDLYGTGTTVTSTILMTSVVVSSFTQGGSSAADASAEEVTLTFGRVQLQYNGANGTSSTSAWDLQKNAAS